MRIFAFSCPKTFDFIIIMIWIKSALLMYSVCIRTRFYDNGSDAEECFQQLTTPHLSSNMPNNFLAFDHLFCRVLSVSSFFGRIKLTRPQPVIWIASNFRLPLKFIVKTITNKQTNYTLVWNGIEANVRVQIMY